MIQKFVLFLLIVVIASACGTRTDQMSSEVANWTFPASAAETITLANDSGDIRIRQTARGDILITATKSARSVADLNGVEVDVKQTGNGISSTLKYLPGSWSVSVAYEIQVPLNKSVRIESSSGNIMVENYQGILDLSTASGTIVMHNVNGEIRADTSSGNIEARDVDGNVNVSSANGSIIVSYRAAPALMDDPVLLTDVLQMWTYSVEPDGTQNTLSPQLPGNGRRIFENSSGGITLQLPHELAVDVFAQLFSGNFKSEFDQLHASADKVRYTGHINGGGPLIILTNATGAIDIEELPVP